MKAITIRQPWAQLIVSGAKDVENRTWSTNYRGLILIHSSAKLERSDVADACDLMECFIPKFSRRVFSEEAKTYPVGAALGVAELVDVVTASDSPWFFGPYGFVLQSVKRFSTPIKTKGALGLWDIPNFEIEAGLREVGL
jgi:hypothetical protein